VAIGLDRRRCISRSAITGGAEANDGTNFALFSDKRDVIGAWIVCLAVALMFSRLGTGPARPRAQHFLSVPAAVHTIFDPQPRRISQSAPRIFRAEAVTYGQSAFNYSFRSPGDCRGSCRVSYLTATGVVR
jgi:hypothetical protein